MQFKVTKLGKHWWVLTDDEECGFVGPYNKRAEAMDAKRGLVEFDKHKDDREFFTSCKD